MVEFDERIDIKICCKVEAIWIIIKSKAAKIINNIKQYTTEDLIKSDKNHSITSKQNTTKRIFDKKSRSTDYWKKSISS